MGNIALAIKYRPKTFDDVTEQDSTKIILKQMLDSGDVAHALLFVGGAGTGKTTCARIFANEINQHMGQPIELDAASHSGVDDVRDIIQQSKMKSLDSEYKVFIIDECHSLSNAAWQAFLKLLEEPPAKSLFIFCTTDPQKIPKTILSRVQRFDFQKISQQGIFDRLYYIIEQEEIRVRDEQTDEALEYIAKIADGGMRTAITYLDKVMAYSNELKMENVAQALGVADYNTMMDLTFDIMRIAPADMVEDIENIHSSGKDLKQFIRQYITFILDVRKIQITGSYEYGQLPNIDMVSQFIKDMEPYIDGGIPRLLNTLVKIHNTIKYDSNPKDLIEVYLLREVVGE